MPSVIFWGKCHPLGGYFGHLGQFTSFWIISNLVILGKLIVLTILGDFDGSLYFFFAGNGLRGQLWLFFC